MWKNRGIKEKSMIRTICLTALLLALAGPVSAHPGHEASGFLHPFTGIDHLLAMVGVGMWAAFLAVPSRARRCSCRPPSSS
jgi:urease accessory protein